MKSVVTLLFVLATAIAIAQVPSFPTTKKKIKILYSPKALESAKTKKMKLAVAAPMPSAPAPMLAAAFPEPPSDSVPYYFINYGPGASTVQVYGVTENNELVLIVPEEAPRLRIPNKTQATFTKLESSPDLVNWTTLGYFTNFTDEFYIADVTATNQPKYFYRLVPQ